MSCDSSTLKCTGTLCLSGYGMDPVSLDCVACNPLCDDCGTSANDCIECFDDTRDKTRSCECNYTKYAILTDP